MTDVTDMFKFLAKIPGTAPALQLHVLPHVASLLAQASERPELFYSSSGLVESSLDILAAILRGVPELNSSLLSCFPHLVAFLNKTSDDSALQSGTITVCAYVRMLPSVMAQWDGGAQTLQQIVVLGKR